VDGKETDLSLEHREQQRDFGFVAAFAAYSCTHTAQFEISDVKCLFCTDECSDEYTARVFDRGSSATMPIVSEAEKGRRENNK